jgi:hypothetical protein
MTRDMMLDSRLNITVGKLQTIRTQFERFDARIPAIAKRYNLNPLLVKSIKEYKVWPDVLPIGYEEAK